MSAQFMRSQAIEGTNALRLNLANNKTSWWLPASEATASREVPGMVPYQRRLKA
jgi:hypothetical protein